MMRSPAGATKRRTQPPGQQATIRVACLLVPDLPLAARLRAEPDLEGSPLVVAAGDGPRAEIVSVSAAAARAGVLAGQSCAQARTRCAGLVLRIRSPELERTAHGALRDAALSFSPRTEAVPPGTGVYGAEGACFLDASGTGALFRSEAGFAAALAARAAALGLPARVSIAGSRSVALLAARVPGEPGDVRVLPAGREAGWLAPLAIEILDPSRLLAEALRRFGIGSLGQLARLPARSLSTRLGPEAIRLARLARGEGDPMPIAVTQEDGIEEALDLEEPLDRLEPLAFVLRRLLGRLGSRLEARGLAGAELRLGLGLAGGGREARRIGLAAPTSDPKTLLRLICLSLEAHPPYAAIESVRVMTRGVPVRADQLDLFRPAGPAPAVLGRTLAEIETLCGEGSVGVPVLPDVHRAGAFTLAPFFAGSASGSSSRSSSRASSRASSGTSSGDSPGDPSEASSGALASLPAASTQALRALRPPVPAQVRERRGMPQWLHSAVASGEILDCSGPWRTTGGWWSSERFAHDHFDVRTRGGAVSRLRYDRILRAWHVDGVYD